MFQLEFSRLRFPEWERDDAGSKQRLCSSLRREPWITVRASRITAMFAMDIDSRPSLFRAVIRSSAASLRLELVRCLGLECAWIFGIRLKFLRCAWIQRLITTGRWFGHVLFRVAFMCDFD